MLYFTSLCQFQTTYVYRYVCACIHCERETAAYILTFCGSSLIIFVYIFTVEADAHVFSIKVHITYIFFSEQFRLYIYIEWSFIVLCVY